MTINDDRTNNETDEISLLSERSSCESSSVHHRAEDKVQTVQQTTTRHVRRSQSLTDIVCMILLLGAAIAFLIGWTHLVHWIATPIEN